MPKLTDQQKLFAQEYVRSGFDRTQAIEAAEYSIKNADSIACRLLKKSQVKAEIDRLIEQIEEKTTVEIAEIIQELRKIAFAPVSQRVNNSDRLRALELLGKYKIMFSDKHVFERTEDIPERKYTPEEISIIREAAHKLNILKARENDNIINIENNNSL